MSTQTNKELRVKVFDRFNKKVRGKKLWDILWQEQGGICAYCGSRIDNKDRNDPFFDLPENNNRLEKGTRRREHIAPLATNPEKMLDYYNLLGVCQGNEKKGEIEHHCDKEKDDNEIFILPTMPDCEDFFKYEEVDIFDGIEIIGENTDAINTIKTLNLNFKVLQERRFKPKEKASIIISEAKERSKGDRSIFVKKLEETVIDISTKKDLEECCFVTKFFIQKAIEDVLKKLAK